MEKQKQQVGERARCACDNITHCGEHAAKNFPTRRCDAPATCVVVVEYNRPRAKREHVLVRLAMCSPCAAWWTSHEHDGVIATYQVQPKAEVSRG